MNENWILCKSPQHQSNQPTLLRYAVATLLPCLAAYLAHLRPALAETPHFMFLGAVVLSALYGGIGPAFFSASLSTILVQVCFVHTLAGLMMFGFMDKMEGMALFLLVSLMMACLVSALRRERNLLKETEERFRVLADGASDAILVMDERGQILFVNPVAERIFGAARPHIVGQNIAGLVPHSLYQPYFEERSEAPQPAVSFHLPGREEHEKKMLLEMTLNACSKHGNRLYTAIIRDITGFQRALTIPA
jgi:PAS domain S-box-containing protein